MLLNDNKKDLILFKAALNNHRLKPLDLRYGLKIRVRVD